MWVVMVQHKTSDQYLTSGKVPTRSIHGFRSYRFLKTLTNFNFRTGELKRIGPKTTDKRWRHRFPHYKSMGAFCCHGNQSLDPICPKTLCSLSPTQVMLHIKFDKRLANWLQRYSSLKVWTTTTDG